MAAQNAAKTGDQANAKPLTPAQTAKPYGTAAKTAAARTPAKKAEANGDGAGAPAQDETAKAIEKLETKTKAINANNVSRVANSQLSADDDKLYPLMSLKTGKPIEKFPAISKDIAKLGVTAVDAMLNALEADRAGGEDVKKQRLRVQIGLKPHPA